MEEIQRKKRGKNRGDTGARNRGDEETRKAANWLM